MAKRLREELENIETEHLSVEDVAEKWLIDHPPPTESQCMEKFADAFSKTIVRIMKSRYPTKSIEIELHDRYVSFDTQQAVYYDQALIDWSNITTLGLRNIIRNKTSELRSRVRKMAPDVLLELVSELKVTRVFEHSNDRGDTIVPVSVPTYKISY